MNPSIKQLIAQSMAQLTPIGRGTGWKQAPSLTIPSGIYTVSPGDLTPPAQFLYRWTLDLGGSWLVINDSTGMPLCDNNDVMANCTIKNGVIVGLTGKEVAFRNRTNTGNVFGMRYLNLEFQNVSAFDCEGSCNVSEMMCEDLQINLSTPGQYAFQYNNMQSVNHWIRRLRLSLAAGTAGFNVLGGGMIHASDIDLESYGGTFLQIGPNNQTPARLGWLNDGYFFEGLRSEFIAPGVLVNNLAGSNVFFSKSNFGVVVAPIAKPMVIGNAVFDSSCLNLSSIGK
jgi:hypothetical protein